jgi:hypothetical protein
MAQWNQITGFLGALNTCDARNAQYVTFFSVSAFDDFKRLWPHLNRSASYRHTVRAGLAGDVYHVGLTLCVKMCKWIHRSEKLTGTFVCRTLPHLKHHTTMIIWKERLHAAGIHFGISLVVAAFSALLVFGLWYPYPYRDISGGRELFVIVVAVDVVLGPLLTFTIFNRAKAWKELRRDLAMVGFLQLAGLGYGLWTVAVARPVHLVFEIDRFRVVHAIDVPEELLQAVPGDINALPWTGPTLLSVRPFKDEKESFDATMAALRGVPLGARPDFWRSYGAAKEEVLRVAKPVANLKSRFATHSEEIDKVLATTGRTAATLLYVPLAGRKAFWTVFIDPATAQPMAFLPLDSF